MFNLNDIDLSHYNLYMTDYAISIVNGDPSGIAGPMGSEITMSFRCPDAYNPTYDEFLKDLTMLNKIKGNTDPRVTDLYDQMITMMALTSET